MLSPAGHLYFHRIADHDPHYTCLPRRAFADLLDAILAVQPIVSVAQALDGTEPRSSDASAPPMVLSFDDGHADLLDFAIPEMIARGIVATLFVPSGHVDGRMLWRRDGTRPFVLSARDLRVLHGLGFDIQCHSGTHVVLAGLADADLDREMVGAADRLADLIGQPIRTFAYPYGVFDDRCRAVARRRFDAAFSTVKSRQTDWNVDRTALRRSFVDRSRIGAAIDPSLWIDIPDGHDA